jgi:hypothetical protein
MARFRQRSAQPQSSEDARLELALELTQSDDEEVDVVDVSDDDSIGSSGVSRNDIRRAREYREEMYAADQAVWDAHTKKIEALAQQTCQYDGCSWRGGVKGSTITAKQHMSSCAFRTTTCLYHSAGCDVMIRHSDRAAHNSHYEVCAFKAAYTSDIE